MAEDKDISLPQFKEYHRLNQIQMRLFVMSDSTIQIQSYNQGQLTINPYKYD